MPTLHSTINELAERFAHDLLAALKGASLDEIIQETRGGHAPARRGPGRPKGSAPKKRGRLARRSAADVKAVTDKIVFLLKSHKAGLRSEGIQAALKLDKREMPRPIHLGLKTKAIRKKGQKRATTYFA